MNSGRARRLKVETLKELPPAGQLEELVKAYNALLDEIREPSKAILDRAFFQDLDITTGSSIPSPNPIDAFKVPFFPTKMVIVDTRNRENFAGLAYPTLTWTPSRIDGSHAVKISNLTGLSTSTRYKITLMVCP